MNRLISASTMLSPFEVYSHIYPLESDAISNLAYYFQFSYPPQQNVEDYTRAFLAETRLWQAHEKKYHFFSTEADGRLILWDFRDLELIPLIVLNSFQSVIYNYCDISRTAREIVSLMEDTPRGGVERVETELEKMTERKLMIRSGSRYLSLALSTQEYSPKAEGLVAMRNFVQSLSSEDSDEARIDLK